MYVWPDGRRYEGEWRCDKMNGFGVHKYANGDRHEGFRLNDKKHGRGKIISKDGIVQESEWNMGQVI